MVRSNIDFIYMDMVDCKMDKKIKLMVLFGGVSGCLLYTSDAADE